MFALALSLLCTPAQAQDLLSVSGVYQPPTDVETDRIDGDLETGFTSFGVGATAPPIRLFDDGLIFLNMFSYSRVSPTFVGEPELDEISNAMNALAWNPLVVVPLTERWSVVSVVSTGLYTNFVGPLSGRDVRVQVLGLASYQASEEARIGFGLAYANFFGRPRIIPAVMGQLKAGRLSVRGTLPKDAWVGVDLVPDRLALGLRGGVEGGFYHRGSDNPRAPDDTFIRYSVGAIGAGLQVSAGPLSITGEAGWAAFRRFEIVIDDDPIADFDLANGLVVRGVLGITPRRRDSRDELEGLDGSPF